jgi:hypothetical protein
MWSRPPGSFRLKVSTGARRIGNRERNLRRGAAHPEVAPAVGLPAAEPGRHQHIGQAAARNSRKLVRARGSDQVLSHRTSMTIMGMTRCKVSGQTANARSQGAAES